jgi:hypothetical protein
MILDDPDYKEYDVFLVNYATYYSGKSPTLAEVGFQVGQLLEDNVFKNHEQIYFIVHSMGGLVTKQILAQPNPSLTDEMRQRVKAVIFFSTPSQGSHLAEAFYRLSRNPQINDMIPADINSYLQTLETQWTRFLQMRDNLPPERRIPKVFCAYETQETLGVMVVGRIYSTTRCDDTVFPITADHIDIVKPSSAQSHSYEWSKNRIRDTAASIDLQRSDMTHYRRPNSEPKPPDVTLRFVYPKAPALVIANPSDSVVRDIKWAVGLWNMDLPDRDDPLPIPVSTFDWIRPHDEGGPQNLFDGPLVAPLLKSGNRLFGSVSVLCPECSRGRTYIVYIVWGKSGWFSEVENEKAGKLIIPANFLKEGREAYFKALEAAVPEKSRIPIAQR